MVAAQTPGTSSDELVGRIMMSLRESEPSIRMRGRTDVAFGGNRGVRVETSRMSDGMEIRGFATACKAGGSYYFLNGSSVGNDHDYALKNFRHLSRHFAFEAPRFPRRLVIPCLKRASPVARVFSKTVTRRSDKLEMSRRFIVEEHVGGRTLIAPDYLLTVSS
jgi:hypothetical protein